MAAKFDSALLKKHHFWFLLIPVGIAFLLAWIGLFFSVPDATSATQTKQESKMKEQKAKNAKARATIAAYTKQVDVLNEQRTRLWAKAWEDQKSIFVWPEGFNTKQHSVVRNLKFGAEIPNTVDKGNVRDQFRDKSIYEEEYRRLIKELAPMQFRTNWEDTLRYVKQ